MKQNFTLTITLFIGILSFAQIPKLKEIQNLKNSEVIIGLSGDEGLDQDLRDILNQFWTISPISEELPISEARKKAKESDNIYVIYIDSYTSRSFKRYVGDNYAFRNISTGYYVGLFAGSKKAIMPSYIPVFEDEFTKEVLAHGVSYMQEIFTMMLDNEIGAMKTLKIIKDNSKDLKEKTLYIPEWWMDSKLTDADISDLYEGKYEIVSHFEWSRAILNKTPGIAYATVIPAPVGGKFVYQHHICDAETGRIYGITQPKGGAFELNGINLSKANKGYVTKKNLKQYNEVLNGK
ncbi:hypothetical protein ACNR9Q_04445 [Maribacter sp. X9]|uniref:hypothetical protein n=1 Tax=Maribacter sp. X9 TaxID=3402159 RepID=UPI003AF33B89